MKQVEMAKQVRRRFRPSMKERKRYLVVVLQGRKNFYFLKKVVREACNVDLRVICFNDRKSKIIICVLRRHLNDVKAALKVAGFNCIGISGTIKRARQKWMKGCGNKKI